jgi:hypothetical protein
VENQQGAFKKYVVVILIFLESSLCMECPQNCHRGPQLPQNCHWMPQLPQNDPLWSKDVPEMELIITDKATKSKKCKDAHDQIIEIGLTEILSTQKGLPFAKGLVFVVLKS